MVLADITSGYNVVEDISQEPRYADLCGFHEEEIRTVLQQVVADCDLPPERTDEALDLMRGKRGRYPFLQNSKELRVLYRSPKPPSENLTSGKLP